MSGFVPEEGEQTLDQLKGLVREGDLRKLAGVLVEVHPSDLAEVVQSVEDEGRQLALMRLLSPELASETLAEMDEGDDRARLLTALSPPERVEILHELADDDAADLIAELEPGDRARILAALPAEEAGDLRDLLSYDEETAGGLMTTDFVSVRSTVTAAEAISAVRVQGREVEDFYTVFVLDTDGRLMGTVPLDDLILADPEEPVENLVEAMVASVPAEEDQEEVGRLMARYNLVSIPVLDEGGRLLGRITFDDVIDVIEAEQTEDILRFAGISDDEELRAGWGGAVATRLPWLVLNLVTLSLASLVILIFETTLQEFIYITVLIPVVAGLGGNAGTQALAVTVRRLAVFGRDRTGRSGVVGKEVVLGVVNGLVLGLVGGGLAAGLAVFKGDTVLLGLVVLLAMWGNILVAGFAGAFIPTVLDRLGIDPAVSSSVFLTTLTDLCGFLLLLGLASSFLLSP